VSALIGLSALGLGIACFWRIRLPTPGTDLESFVLAATATLALLGMLATGLALLGWFAAGPMALLMTCVTAIAWPRARPQIRRVPGDRASSDDAPSSKSPRRRTRGSRFATIALLLATACSLRLPLNRYPLGGRDQGTYTLRAAHTIRTGELGWIDPVLAAAGIRQAAEDPAGAQDLLGLYPKRGEPWLQGLYEGSYRPGFYLADRDRGIVVPQFLHLHPMLLATAGLLTGSRRCEWIVLVQGLLMILAMVGIGERLWPRSPWAWLPAVLLALAPIAIWVHRTALSESAYGLFVWAAVLAALRDRDHGSGLGWSALALGATAWTRGNAWIHAPLLLVCVLLRPVESTPRRGPLLGFAGLLLASVLVHARTTFPYLHDEFARLAGAVVHLVPIHFELAAIVLVGIVLIAEWLRPHPLVQHFAAVSLRVAPFGLALVGAFALIAYAVFYGRAEPGPPYSRLDAGAILLGWPLVVVAGLGLLLTVVRVRPSSQADAWLVGMGATVAATLILYARRNLPESGLYYYGRYLLPELLPLACILATVTLATLARHRSLALRWTAAPLVVAIVWHLAGVLVLEPTCRLREFAGADALIDELANATEPDAIVIAGGEGWHHGHTFNQVGGALAVAHGRTVLPYQTREAAYGSLSALLDRERLDRERLDRERLDRERPDRERPVYLLLNEASHALTLHRDALPIAALDDRLPPPFRARKVLLTELFMNRLTPVDDRVPTRVTRDELRMALIAVVSDDRVVHHGDSATIDRGDGTRHVDDACRPESEPQTIDVPADRTENVRQLVLIAGSPGVTGRSWAVAIDGSPLGTDPSGLPSRLRNTLGPFVVVDPARTVTITNRPEVQTNPPCPRLAEVRWLGPDRSALAAETTTVSFGPGLELGHPVARTRWVRGLALSRYRSVTQPSPSIENLALILEADQPIEFASTTLPPAPLLAVIHVTRSRLTAGGRVRLDANGETIGSFEPPPHHDSSWSSPPLTWIPATPTATLSLHLVDAPANDEIWIRDLALFTTDGRPGTGVGATP